MIELHLPYPPSGNHAWKHVGSRHYLTRQAGAYHREVAVLVRQGGAVLQLEQRLAVTCAIHPPDRRRRDLDNAWKVIGDSLTRAGVWSDDYLIERLTLLRQEPVKRGLVVVTICPIC